MPMHHQNLPQLPEPFSTWREADDSAAAWVRPDQPVFSASQMKAYALAAMALREPPVCADSAATSDRKAANPSIFLQNLSYFFARTDGSYSVPPGAVGDLLMQAKREIEARPPQGESFEQWLKRVQPAGCVSDMERGWKARQESQKQAVARVGATGDQLGREAVIDMCIASGLSDMLRLDSEASRELSVRRLQAFCRLLIDASHQADKEAVA